MLREGLRFLDPSGWPGASSSRAPDEGEGKTTVAVSLASTLAAVGRRVILVEADMRRPTAATQLGIPANVKGLSDLLVSDVDLDEVLLPSRG